MSNYLKHGLNQPLFLFVLFLLAIWHLILPTGFGSRESMKLSSNIIYPSIFNTAGANPSCHWPNAGWHPGQVHHHIFIFLNPCSNIALALLVRFLSLSHSLYVFVCVQATCSVLLLWWLHWVLDPHKACAPMALRTLTSVTKRLHQRSGEQKKGELSLLVELSLFSTSP